MKKLTIITINFNHLEGLKRTIDSVVNQTFTDYEWIVVDGGSTDGSKELLEQYQEHFAWWCSEPDEGVYNAMNKGIKHATGEYINFMNAGDVFFAPTILSEVFSEPHIADILYGVMVKESENGEISSQRMMKPKINWWDFYYDTFGHQAEFIKTKLFALKLYDESYRIAADAEWNTYMVVYKHVTSEYIPSKISIIERGGLSENVGALLEERQRICDCYYSMITENDVMDLYYLAIVKRFWISRTIYFVLSRTMNRIRRMLNIKV